MKSTNTDDLSACIGCGVCMLSCPLWQQHQSQDLTFCGRARLAMEQADDDDLARSAGACILCGSCEPLCPRGIPTQAVTIRLLQRLARKEGGTAASGPGPVAGKKKAASKRLFLPGPAVRKNSQLVERCMKLLGRKGAGIRCADDDGAEIAQALETGVEIDPARLAGFLAPLRGAREVIAADGLMVNFLSRILGSKVSVRGLGHALLELDAVRAGIRSGDLYLIETRAYNARRDEQAMFYETLRRVTGCFLNLDLHRVATPTGMAGGGHRRGRLPALSVEAQVRWILEGRKAERVVAEHPEDGTAFGKYTELPVVHLAEVAEP